MIIIHRVKPSFIHVICASIHLHACPDYHLGYACRIRMCIFDYMYVCVYIYIYIYTYIHTFMTLYIAYV